MHAVEDAQGELALSREAQPVSMPIEVIRAKRTKGAAFTLACDASGLEDKEIHMALGIDKAVFSRLKAGSATLDNDLLGEFCRKVKNTIYPEWLAYQVGSTLVVIRSEAERRAEAAEARATAAEQKAALLVELLQGKRAA